LVEANLSQKPKQQWKRYYIHCIAPNHPFGKKGNIVFEHRLVMEQWLGEHDPNHPALVEINGKKYIKRQWVVHHINGKKDDNRIENLKIMTNREHRALHFLGNKNPNWIGGQYLNKKGRILILCKTHPFCNVNGYVLKHHLVMEKYLRKHEPDHPALISFGNQLYLRKDVIIQHLNSNKSDNRIENLLLYFCGVGYTPKNSMLNHTKQLQIDFFKQQRGMNI